MPLVIIADDDDDLVVDVVALRWKARGHVVGGLDDASLFAMSSNSSVPMR